MLLIAFVFISIAMYCSVLDHNTQEIVIGNLKIDFKFYETRKLLIAKFSWRGTRVVKDKEDGHRLQVTKLKNFRLNLL